MSSFDRFSGRTDDPAGGVGFIMHRIGVLCSVGWCEGWVRRTAESGADRFFDRLRPMLIGELEIHDASIAGSLEFLPLARLSGSYIEAVVDFEPTPAPNRALLNARTRLPMMAITASGAIIRGDLVALDGTTEIPPSAEDPISDLRIVFNASIEIGGSLVINNAVAMINLRKLAFYGRALEASRAIETNQTATALIGETA